MKENLKAGDWISVNNLDCVVTRIYEKPFTGMGEVVYNKDKPTTKNFDWDEDREKYYFSEERDFGGYGHERCPYIQQLKKGKYLPHITYK